jgi:hypothetical protein
MALRPSEAAKALGISERKFREMLPGLPCVRRGGVVLVPVAGLREWLRDASKAEHDRVEKVVAEILESVGSEEKD